MTTVSKIFYSLYLSGMRQNKWKIMISQLH